MCSNKLTFEQRPVIRPYKDLTVQQSEGHLNMSIKVKQWIACSKNRRKNLLDFAGSKDQLQHRKVLIVQIQTCLEPNVDTQKQGNMTLIPLNVVGTALHPTLHILPQPHQKRSQFLMEWEFHTGKRNMVLQFQRFKRLRKGSHGCAFSLQSLNLVNQVHTSRNRTNHSRLTYYLIQT